MSPKSIFVCFLRLLFVLRHFLRQFFAIFWLESCSSANELLSTCRLSAKELLSTRRFLGESSSSFALARGAVPVVAFVGFVSLQRVGSK